MSLLSVRASRQILKLFRKQILDNNICFQYLLLCCNMCCFHCNKYLLQFLLLPFEWKGGMSPYCLHKATSLMSN